MLCVAAYLLIAFIPRTYNVLQLQKRKGTQYWDLGTGSRIAYMLVPAKGIKKPYPIIYLQGGPGGFISDRNIKILAPLSEEDCKVPILIMKGQCDSQPWGFVNEYLELFPNHQLKIIPDAGHSISVEQPELYLKYIREFLNSDSAKSLAVNSTN